MISFVFLIVGFLLLIDGANKFVEGASAAARKFGVPPLIIGLTIVAFGTSAPELAVSTTAALKGANEIALGNVLGSNLFNLLVVGGLSAIIAPLSVSRDILQRDWPYSIGAAVLLLVMIWSGSAISRPEGLTLVVLLLLIMGTQIRAALRDRTAREERTENVMRTPFIILHLIFGLAAILIGGDFAVDGATGIARMFGLSETLIGLTIVALGTSLPELVTSLAAGRKGETDIAVGNIIGSNLFNLLCILGISTSICPITVQPTALIDCAMVVLTSIVFLLPARRGKIGRTAGSAMVLTYIVYAVYLCLR